MRRSIVAAVALGGAAAVALTSAPAQAVEQATAVAAKARTYVGTSVGTPFGPVQVKARVLAGRVTKVTAIAYPNSDPKSSSINAYAIPRLQQQAVIAQSASIDGVSGASWSSSTFARSLQSALAKAGIS